MAASQATTQSHVSLVRVMDVLQGHITEALCQAVFRQVRRTERQRLWTLKKLVEFWMAVMLRAPQALGHALADALEGREPLFPAIPATTDAFFQRCRDLRPAFFAEVFRAFTTRLIPQVPLRDATALAPLQTRFPAVLILDGSRLAAIAHRLKLLWRERAVVLPGCLLAGYDLFRGLCCHLQFCADAAAGEMTRAKALLAELAPDTLVVGDRLYGTADFFTALHADGRQLWGLVRRNRRLGLRKRKRLHTRRHQGGCLEDWLVAAGSGASAPVQTLRYLRWRQDRTRYEVLTNVLDPTRLSAAEALALYADRWSIERMYCDLKDVLNLHRLDAANPNAVAMQVYAAGLVDHAMRVAQGEVAEAAGIAPEDIAPAKFFPKLAAACPIDVVAQLVERRLRQRNPHPRWRTLEWDQERWTRVSLAAIRVERRRGIRRHRRYCAARCRWKSFAHVRGGRKLMKLT